MDGDLKPGDMLPKESDLERMYGVSRAPVRQAMGKLEMESMIVRRQGKGTFVADKAEQIRWFLFGGFREFYERHFEELYCRTYLIETIPPDERAKQVLNLKKGRMAIHIHRVRFWSDTPVFSIHTYLPDTMNIDAFRKAGDFFNISNVLKKYFSINLQSAEESITAVSADPHTASSLKIAEGSAVLQVERVNRDDLDNIVHFSRYFCRSDICGYKVSY
jgi:DNA-binding GntR family transcriptional regulator